MKVLCTTCDGDGFLDRGACRTCAGEGKLDVCGEMLRLNGKTYVCLDEPNHGLEEHAAGSIRWEAVRAGVQTEQVI